MNPLFLLILIPLLDLPWLFVSNTFASGMIRKIQGENMKLNVWPAALVYVALAYLATLPKTGLQAFLLGLSVYTVYDFTNLSIFERYDWRFAVADSLWGGILFWIVFQIIHLLK
jgi:uncharacterized membrane protein